MVSELNTWAYLSPSARRYRNRRTSASVASSSAVAVAAEAPLGPLPLGFGAVLRVHRFAGILEVNFPLPRFALRILLLV